MIIAYDRIDYVYYYPAGGKAMRNKIKYIIFAVTAMLICLSFTAFAGVDLSPEEIDKMDKVEDVLHCHAIGDADGDGDITSADARIILRYSVNLGFELSDETIERCDVDSDKEITSSDARKILRFSVNLEEQPEHKIIEVVVIPPTCKTKGLTVKLCTTCMKIYAETTTEPINHIPGTWQTIEKPNCQHEGKAERYCIFCGKLLETTELKKTGHDWSEWEYPEGPSCTEARERIRHCMTPGCGEIQHEIEPARGEHSYKWVYEKVPTCTEDGLRVYKCTHCGNVAATETIKASGHMPMEWETIKKPTCTEPGLRGKKCIFCGKAVETEEIPALGHDYDENFYKVKVEPTCAQEGVAEVVCKRCGESYEIPIPKKEHTLVEDWHVTKEPTCTENGLKEAKCRFCGDIKEEVPALGHDYVWSNTKAPTCTAEGEKTGICSRCGDTIIEELPKIPHDIADSTLIVETEPTCGKEGRGYKICKCCQQKIYETIPATGKHVKGEEKVLISPATCTENAIYGYKCIYCGETLPEWKEEQQKTALGHDYGDWQITKPATCTENGIKIRKCSRCASIQTEEIIAPGKHTEGEWKVETLPTCTEEGLEVKRCEKCGEILDSRPIAKAPHTPGEIKIIVAPTCSGTTITKGKYSAVCKECGALIGETEFTRLKVQGDYILNFTDECDLSSKGNVVFTITVPDGMTAPSVVRYAYGKDKNFEVNNIDGKYVFSIPKDISEIETITIQVF